MPNRVPSLADRLRCLAWTGLAGVFLALSGGAGAQDQPKWSDRDSRLANEYLALLVGQPEYGRMVDLLWGLYEKHQATPLLLENVGAQAQTSRHPSALLVQGHLLRKSGDLKGAAAIYDEVLKIDAANRHALRARADVARELSDPAAAYTLLQRWADLIPDTDPQKPAAWLELGTLAHSSGRGAEAADCWEKAARLQPANFDLARQVAELLLRAGFADRAAAFYATLAEQQDPQQRLNAYFDLARIHEHADQFAEADAALLKGLALLDFRDGRYADFFRRRVRLHERFGALDDLRQALLTAAEKRPRSEQALRDTVRFYEITVDPDEHLRWLRTLVSEFAQTDEYRWELVRALLDHEGAAEAAKLLDARMKGDGSDLPAIVFLRCEADLRAGDPAAATARLKKLLGAQGAALEVEKQALAFAQARALDAVIELILKARVDRDPAKAEAVFELAGFYRARKDMPAADALLRKFTGSAASEPERQRRLNDAAAFLAAGSDLDSAIVLAREAAGRSGAGREEFLNLADLLAEHGDNEEAITLLERAWQASGTDEQRIDVDERLFSVLMGGGETKPASISGIASEFKLPDAFTGAGFASDTPAQSSPEVPEAVIEKARALIAGASGKADLPPEHLFRAAWWAIRAEMFDEAYPLLGALAIDPRTGAGRMLPVEAEKLLLDLCLTDGNKALAARTLQRLIQQDPPNRVRYYLRMSELLMESEQFTWGMLQDDRLRVADPPSGPWRLSVAASRRQLPGAPTRIADTEPWRHGWVSVQNVRAKSLGPPPPPARAATELLERAYREFPDSEALLGALTSCYSLQRRNDDALRLWKAAVERAPKGMATPLRERYADLLLRQQRLPDYVQEQVAIVEEETDVKSRREIFKRFLDRLLWTEQGGELAPEVRALRLELVTKALSDQLQRHPFDGFFPEALALVYERNGDAAKAFASMKQAYYTAPDTPFSLSQLRDAALRVSDLKAAIYFQKQIAASAPPSELAAESRRLVELLEQTFQIAEADRVRRRLESRFSQNAAALEDLAEHYQATGQDEAERRVYEQVAKVRPWDARSQLRIALKCLRLADETAAEKHLRDILDRTAAKAPKPTVSLTERLPLPLADSRKPGSAAPVAEISSLLDTAPGLEREEMNRLRAFLNLPRPEFMQLPETVPLVRLRAIEELSRLLQQDGGPALATWQRQWTQDARAAPVEKLWALYYSGAGADFRKSLRSLLGPRGGLENQFCLVWLTIRSHGMEDALQWTAQTGLDLPTIDSRKRLLLSVVSMLADLDAFRYRKGQLAALGSSRLLRDPSLRDITRRLQDQQRYPEALELGESTRRSPGSILDDFMLGRIAQSAERWDLAREYLAEVVRTPGYPGIFRGTYDPYLFSLSTTTRLATSAQEREETLRQALRHLQSMPDSTITTLHRAAVIGLAGAPQPAADEVTDLITGDLIAAQTIGESRGNLLPQGSPRGDEPLHLHALWEETRDIQGSFVQQGLGSVVTQVNDKLVERWGNVGLSSRNGLAFGEWRLSHLMRQMRQSNYPTRLRLIREYLASVDMRMEMSVETLGELGSRLETSGMSREAIEVYRMLPSRAPANPDYAIWLIRACEVAQETRMGAEFTLQLLLAEPPMKPPQPGDEVLREKHARFLALDFDIDELSRLGLITPVTRVLQGRIPPEVPYLRELALLHERLGHDAQALAAWDRLHEAFVVNAESGIQADAECCLHRGQLMRKAGQMENALAALREVPLTEQSGVLGHEALKLRAELAVQTRAWDDFQDLMATAVERKSLDVISHLTDLMRVNGRNTEALNFLTQAERSLKEDSARFQLRLELLKLLADDPAWTPERGRSQVASLFRVRNRDRAALQKLLTWMQRQAQGPNHAAWRTLLRAEARAGTDRPVAALALCAFARGMPDNAEDDFLQGWKAAREGDRICLELGAEALLQAGKAHWAWQACLVLQDLPSLRLDGQKLPLMVTVAHAMADRVIVRELFSETIRMPTPGGNRVVEWIDAFARAGEDGLARELFQAALDHLASTDTAHPELYAAWIRYLINHQEFDAAETFLMRHSSLLLTDCARLTFELYQGWGKLRSLRSELAKFHLPGGVSQEVLFLASQTLGLPPPVPARTASPTP